MNRPGLRRVVKTVRTKRGVKQQSFWVRAAQNKEVRNLTNVAKHALVRTAAAGAGYVVGAAVGAFAGAAVGRLFGNEQTGMLAGKFILGSTMAQIASTYAGQQLDAADRLRRRRDRMRRTRDDDDAPTPNYTGPIAGRVLGDSNVSLNAVRAGAMFSPVPSQRHRITLHARRAFGQLF